jgi:hypothetical protein
MRHSAKLLGRRVIVFRAGEGVEVAELNNNGCSVLERWLVRQV